MKKALGILSVLVLITVMMISCNAEQKLDDTVGVSFNLSNSRELSVANESFVAVDSSDLTWYYHGEKKTDTEFITGQSASMTEGEDGYWTRISTGNLLSNTYVTFSQGQWSFEIKAMKGDTQMYYGKTNGNVLLTKGNNTISISVSPFVSGVKGTLKIDSVYIDPKDAGSDNVAPNKLFVNGAEKTFTKATDGKSISFTESVEPGTYTVEVKRVGEDTGVVLASASKTVVVYSGLTTTISGSVEEDTTSGKFDPKPIKPEGTETVTVPGTGDAVVEFVNVTPSMEADKSTTVTIPSAVVSSATDAVTLDIVVKDSESVADSSFDVTTGNGVAASISLTMKEGETPITDFGSNKVTVETYIETGLSGVTVKYNGTGDDPTDVDYDSVTGKLTFKTTHFSEFYIVADAQAKIGNVGYCTLQTAFNVAETNDTITLLNDVNLIEPLIVDSKSITLDLNGKAIHLDVIVYEDDTTSCGGVIKVLGTANLTVNGSGTVDYTNVCYDQGGADTAGYLFDVMDHGVLTIEDGYYYGAMGCVQLGRARLTTGETARVYIKGGMFKSEVIYGGHYWTLNKMDGTTTQFVVSGGSFKDFNPADGKTESPAENFMKEWFSTKAVETEEGTIYEVCSAYEDDEINISSAEGLLEFARLVNEEGKTFSGKTVKLTDDISLSGIEWTPIGTNADGANKFKGIFDGQGHTISNMTVNQGVEYHAAGFFGALNGTAKNIIFDNATVISISEPNADGNTDNGTAVVAGSIYTSGSIEGVTVKNSSVSGNRYVGGVSGYTYGSVKNCTVENTTITSTPDNLTGSYDNGDKAGGVVGAFWHENNTHVISGNTVENVTVKGYRDIGGIVGYANGNVVRNTVNGLTLIQDYSILTTPRTTVEAVIGRHEGFEVDASNTFSDVTVRVDNVSTDTEFSASLKNKAQNIIVNLSGDVTYDVTPWIHGTGTMGGADTEAITINGNGNTITFNNTDSDANGIYIANENAVLTINNAKLTNSGYNDGPWNRHDICFYCKVVLNKVISDKSIAVAKDSSLNNVDISDDRATDDYLLWIQAYGETVNLIECNLHNTKTTGTTRGVAIKDEYISAPVSVTLNVSGTTFVTTKKAAVLVTSTAGADITWGNGNDISDVVADSTNAVWNDADRTAAWDLVTVTGCTKFQET